MYSFDSGSHLCPDGSLNHYPWQTLGPQNRISSVVKDEVVGEGEVGPGVRGVRDERGMDLRAYLFADVSTYRREVAPRTLPP